MLSILDTDLYKFTTSYAYMKCFPDAECTFSFIDRNRIRRTDYFLRSLKTELESLETLRLSDSEFAWCVENIPFIPRFYWEWLKTFRFEREKMKPYLDDDGVLHIDVTDNAYKATLYEICVMSSVPEINNSYNSVNMRKTEKVLMEKIRTADEYGIAFSEFGTRRRFSFDIQDFVCMTLSNNSKTCVGTSNVYFSKKYRMKPIGTHPHEWFMFHGAQYGYKNANYLALENWVNVYDGNLGIALSDTFTSDAFFRNFSLKQAKLFDGVRQDSGDEFDFIEKTIRFYKSKGIDPQTKTIVFSNALDFNKAVKISEACKGRICCSFGIGTNLTCDVYKEGKPDVRYDYENIVMKMSRCRMNANQPWFNTIKLSDDEGKHMGSEEEIASAKFQLGI